MDVTTHSSVPAGEGNPSKDSKPVVTQQMLRDYLDLKAKVEQQRDRRLQLIDLLEAGAAIEPGPLGAAIREAEQRRLNGRTLVRLLGEDRVRELKERLEPVVQKQLIVGEQTR